MSGRYEGGNTSWGCLVAEVGICYPGKQERSQPSYALARGSKSRAQLARWQVALTETLLLP